MTKSVEVIASVLDCLPDQSQNASRLIFASLVNIAKEVPLLTVQYVIDEFDKLPKEKLEGIYSYLVTTTKLVNQFLLWST